MKEIYAIKVGYTNAAGKKDIAVSQMAFEELEDAKKYISERADTIEADGWYGRYEFPDSKPETMEYYIQALQIEKRSK